jgi:hypothetical protein
MEPRRKPPDSWLHRGLQLAIQETSRMDDTSSMLLGLLIFGVPVAKVVVGILILLDPKGGRSRLEDLLPRLPARHRAEQYVFQKEEAARRARWEAERVARRAQREACRRARRAQRESERAARRALREAAYRARGIEPGHWAWFKALPDVSQAILMGLAFAVPAGVGLVFFFQTMSPLNLS